MFGNTGLYAEDGIPYVWDEGDGDCGVSDDEDLGKEEGGSTCRGA